MMGWHAAVQQVGYTNVSVVAVWPTGLREVSCTLLKHLAISPSTIPYVFSTTIDMPDNFDRIRAAAVDGRAHNVFYRQTQLERLCRTLIDSGDEIREAIATDYDHTPSEITVELNLTLESVKRDYALLHPKRALEEEFLIAANKDAPNNRIPVGMVYIEPTTHTLFHSTVVPLSAAIAAGNCIILLVSKKL